MNDKTRRALERRVDDLEDDIGDTDSPSRVVIRGDGVDGEEVVELPGNGPEIHINETVVESDWEPPEGVDWEPGDTTPIEDVPESARNIGSEDVRDGGQK